MKYLRKNFLQQSTKSWEGLVTKIILEKIHKMNFK